MTRDEAEKRAREIANANYDLDFERGLTVRIAAALIKVHDEAHKELREPEWATTAHDLPERPSRRTLNRDDILQALARAYCHDANTRKVLDADLLVAAADEIMELLK